MQKYKFICQYDGSRYSGWQKQPQQLTVQQTLEDCFYKITRETAPVIASGRTDTGVHAAGQACHIGLQNKISTDLPRFVKSINSLLPHDIKIISIEEADPLFHAIASAKKKEYRYYIWNSQVSSPFNYKYTHHYPHNIDIQLMIDASQLIIGTHDFLSFSNSGRSYKSTIRTIDFININKEGDVITLAIQGNGFLYKMVRNITGLLIAIGSKKMDASSIPQIIQSRNRRMLPTIAPAQGLVLHNVMY